MSGYSGGVYTRVHNWYNDRIAGLDITDTRMDAEDDSIAAALSMCILKDGSQIVTADIPMNGKRITGLGDPLLSTHAMTMGASDIRYARADAPASMTGALTVTSSSGAALAVGPAGASLPTLNVYSAAPSCQTGLNIIGQSAGAGIYLDATGPGANEPINIRAKGTGTITFTGGCLYAPAVDGTTTADAAQSIVVQNKTSAAGGDGALASIAFLCQGTYGAKLSLRADGVFGIGGWSATAWKWYVSLTSGVMTCLNGANFGGAVVTAGQLNLSGAMYAGNHIQLTGTSPTIIFSDTDWANRKLTHDQGWLGVLRHDEAQWDWRLHNGGTMDCAAGFTAAGNVTAYSDETLKENIHTIPYALATVRTMRGVHYTMKETQEKGSGVIAQEFRLSAPELVGVTPEGILTVAYGNVVGYLIEAIKELSDHIDKFSPLPKPPEEEPA